MLNFTRNTRVGLLAEVFQIKVTPLHRQPLVLPLFLFSLGVLNSAFRFRSSPCWAAVLSIDVVVIISHVIHQYGFSVLFLSLSAGVETNFRVFLF